MNDTTPAFKRYHHDELTVGQRFTGPTTIVMQRDRMIGFAAEFDPQPFHLHDEGAESSLFGSLAASGWDTAAATMRLLVDGGLPIAESIVASRIQLAWPKPTRLGDKLHVESEVLEIVPSKTRPGRATITTRSQTLNQHGDVVQSTTASLVGHPCPASAT